jgi:hypothetical protein
MILYGNGDNGIGPVGVKDHIQSVFKGIFFIDYGELGFVSGSATGNQQKEQKSQCSNE